MFCRKPEQFAAVSLQDVCRIHKADLPAQFIVSRTQEAVLRHGFYAGQFCGFLSVIKHFQISVRHFQRVYPRFQFNARILSGKQERFSHIFPHHEALSLPPQHVLKHGPQIVAAGLCHCDIITTSVGHKKGIAGRHGRIHRFRILQPARIVPGPVYHIVHYVRLHRVIQCLLTCIDLSVRPRHVQCLDETIAFPDILQRVIGLPALFLVQILAQGDAHQAILDTVAVRVNV